MSVSRRPRGMVAPCRRPARRRHSWGRAVVAAAGLAIMAGFTAGGPAAQEPADALHASLSEILDLYVRDGFVYYAALKADRSRLDRYLNVIDERPAGWASWTDAQQAAFWVNAYNAVVLRTVIDHYPIRGRAANYPSASIRQIPGAFETRTHRLAGERLTLDQIELEKVAAFDDPRLLLALGRGAVGSPRLRSEAYRPPQLEAQLQAAVGEFATTPRYVQLDRESQRLRVSPILSWREARFAAAHADDNGQLAPGRTPLERAIVALIGPHLFPSEREFLAENRFQLVYQEFDWRLNDLTGGRPQ